MKPFSQCRSCTAQKWENFDGLPREIKEVAWYASYPMCCKALKRFYEGCLRKGLTPVEAAAELARLTA